MSAWGCLWVPFFTAAAAIRSEPGLAERPLVIVRGAPPASCVVEANAAARERGVAPGMTETEARARCPGLVRRALAPAAVASAHHALLEAALTVSPRVEDAGPGEVAVDTAGLQRLVGDAAAIGARLVRQVRAVGLSGRAAIAGSRTAARIAVKATTAAVVVVPSSEERGLLAPAPLTLLDLPAEIETTLARWGVRTLGELASLPRAELGERLGPAGLRAHDLALGRDPTPFTPYVPPPFWQEAQSLDWEVTDLPALVAVLGAVLERLVARLTAAHVWADALEIHLDLASGVRDDRTLALAYPAREARLMLAVLRLELEARPPSAPVTGVALSARPAVAHAGQGGLGQPPAPRQRDLAALMTRLVELVGDDNVGSAVLIDSYRADAFTLAPFAPPEAAPESMGGSGRPPNPPALGAPRPRRGAPRQRDSFTGSDARAGAPSASLVLRRLRPARRVEVVVDGGRPARVRWGEVFSRVRASAGPWRASGEWWDSRAWARDEWDLLLGDGTLCRLAHDCLAGHWFLDGVYD